MKKPVAVCSIILISASACTSIEKTSKEACKSYGFEPGTTQFAECVQEKVASRQERVQDALDDMQETADGFGEYENQDSTECFTTYSGNTSTTSCY